MNNEIVSIKDLSKPALISINKKEKGLSSGLYELDNLTRGFKPSEYILIAARPSMGKTCLATDIALQASEKHNVLFFSLEMSPVTIVQRMLSNISEIDLQKMFEGKILNDGWKELEKARKRLNDLNLWFDGSSFSTTYDIANKISMVDNVDLVIIDYIQLMSGSGGNSVGRVEEMSEISRQLKGLAKNINKPVIVLSQLSRKPDVRPDHRPLLSDLRESGSLEQDADMVLFIYREGYYKQQKADGSAEIILSKNRNGPTGKVDCYFNKSLVRFENYKLNEGW